MTRPYDLILYGATGFTGGLVAEYLAQREGGENLRIAIAGRDEDKLRRVRDRLALLRPAWADLALVRADAEDPESLRRLAASTRVVLTTVGPYARYGEPLVAACVEHATHYVDLTGEPAFWTRIIERHHHEAATKGCAIVPCCGFDSVPHDLGVRLTLDALVAKGGAKGPVEVTAYVAASGGISGGTWQSALGIARDLRAHPGLRDDTKLVRYRSEVGKWVVGLPLIDPLVVRRSAELIGEGYGSEFRYEHLLQTRSLGQALGIGVGALAIAGLAQLGPTRRWLQKRVPSGEGPDAARRARGWFRVRLVARGDGARVVGEIRGREPGYDHTSKMIAECALALVAGEARRSGVLTPVAAFDRDLYDRLVPTGMSFEILEPR